MQVKGIMSLSKQWVVVHKVNGDLKLLPTDWFESETDAENAAVEANAAMQTDEFFAMNWSIYYRATS